MQDPARSSFTRRCCDVGREIGVGLTQVTHTFDEHIRQLRSHEGAGRDVVLVHGWGATIGAFRTGRRRLDQYGYSSVYAHPYSAHRGDVLHLAADLTRHIDRLVDRGGAPVHLIGWSLGGVIATAVDLIDGGDSRLASLTTICTPHRGSRTADRLRWLGPLGGAGRDLRTGSSLLWRLADARRTAGGSRPMLTIGAAEDLVVDDHESSVDGVVHCTIPDAGHFSILERDETWAVVAEHLRDVDGVATDRRVATDGGAPESRADGQGRP